MVPAIIVEVLGAAVALCRGSEADPSSDGDSGRSDMLPG
jgi:hypothetical protein